MKKKRRWVKKEGQPSKEGQPLVEAPKKKKTPAKWRMVPSAVARGRANTIRSLNALFSKAVAFYFSLVLSLSPNKRTMWATRRQLQIWSGFPDNTNSLRVITKMLTILHDAKWIWRKAKFYIDRKTGNPQKRVLVRFLIKDGMPAQDCEGANRTTWGFLRRAINKDPVVVKNARFDHKQTHEMKDILTANEVRVTAILSWMKASNIPAPAFLKSSNVGPILGDRDNPDVRWHLCVYHEEGNKYDIHLDLKVRDGSVWKLARRVTTWAVFNKADEETAICLGILKDLGNPGGSLLPPALPKPEERRVTPPKLPSRVVSEEDFKL